MEIKRQNPEVMVAREFLARKREIINLRNKAHDNEISERMYDDMMTDLEPAMNKVKAEAIDRFVSPQQSHENEYNKEEGFTDWFCSWRDYFASMSARKENAFLKLENQYLDTGSCFEYEQIKLPKKYQIEISDLAIDDWIDIRSADMPKFTQAAKLGKVRYTDPNALRANIDTIRSK